MQLIRREKTGETCQHNLKTVLLSHCCQHQNGESREHHGFDIEIILLGRILLWHVVTHYE